MVDTTIQGLGQIKSAGDERALFLKQFSGEVLTQFMRKNIAMQLHDTIAIDGAKSFQWPVLGRSSSARYVSGDNLFDKDKNYVSKVQEHERIIHLDRPIIAGPHILDNFDEKISHFQIRNRLASEMGQELAYKMDINVLSTMISAARIADGDASLVDGEPGGFRIDSTFSTASQIQSAFKDARQRFDEKDIPTESRYAVLRPADYLTLIDAAPDALNRDFGNTGNGDLASGEIFRMFGFQIMWTNNLPSTDLSGTVDAGAYNTTLYPNALQTKALFVQREAIGTVTGMGVAVKAEERFEYNDAYAMKATYAMGHGVLRPGCAIEVYDSAIV